MTLLELVSPVLWLQVLFWVVLRAPVVRMGTREAMADSA